jgi:tetratricopeptide (TPR) repeat protein/predicted Ser/Thr protein kinase
MGPDDPPDLEPTLSHRATPGTTAHQPEPLPDVSTQLSPPNSRLPGAFPPDGSIAIPGYEIVRKLGTGGVGAVYLARDERLKREVAIKTLRDTNARPEIVARFWAEAEVMAAVKHPHVVQVYELGRDSVCPFIAMEYLTGGALTTRLAGAPLTPLDAVALVEKVARGVAAAHELGIVHRDLKPGNVLLTADGEPKVADFGLAKRLTNDLTRTQSLMGTPAYMAPEQAAGRAKFVGPPADVWALGVILYECVAGARPFDADTVEALLDQIVTTDPAPLRGRVPGLRRDLDTVVAKCLAKEPEHRYPTANELADDLGRLLSGRPVLARRVGSVERAWRWCQRNPALAVVGAVATAALVLAACTGWVGYVQTTAALKGEADRRVEAERAEQSALVAKADADRATAEAQQLAAKLGANLRLSLETLERVFEVVSGSARRRSEVQVLFASAAGRAPSGWSTWTIPIASARGPNVDPGTPGNPQPVVAGDPDTALVNDKVALIEAVLGFYDKFAHLNALSSHVQLDAARASRRVFEAHVWLNRPEKALAAYHRSVELLESLVAKFPDNAEMRLELATVYAAAPPAALARDPEAPLRRALELSGNAPRLAALVRVRLGLLREQVLNWQGAETEYGKALGLFAAAGPVDRTTPGSLDAVISRLRLAAVLGEQGKWAPARKILEESVAELAPLVIRGDARFGPQREWLRATYLAQADVCEKLGDHRSAEEARRSAEQHSDPLPGKEGPKSLTGPKQPKKNTRRPQ